MEVEGEVTIDAKCPECGRKFEATGIATMDIEPPERDEDG